jgi:hypothetical protein
LFVEEKALSAFQNKWDAHEATSPCPQIEISRPGLVGIVGEKNRFAGTLSIKSNYTF